MLGWHTRPGVAHLGDHMTAIGTGRHGEPSTPGHRVASVQKQVEEHLLELMLHAHDRHGRIRQLTPDPDLAHLELVLQKREHVADDRVQVHVLALATLNAGPRQREQTVDDLGRPERLPFDLLEKLRPRIRRVGLFEQHLGIARNARQGRVHLVRHAGREQPDRGHLLRDLQLLLEPHPFGDVLDEENRPFNRSRSDRALERRDGGVDQQAFGLPV